MSLQGVNGVLLYTHTRADDVVDGYDTGAVRVTVGWMNTRADIDYFLNFVAKAYLSKAAPALAAAEAAAARRKAAYAAK